MQRKEVSGLKEEEIGSSDVWWPALTEEPHHETDHVSWDTADNQQSWGSSTPAPESWSLQKPVTSSTQHPAAPTHQQSGRPAYMLAGEGIVLSADVNTVQLAQVYFQEGGSD